MKRFFMICMAAGLAGVSLAVAEQTPGLAAQQTGIQTDIIEKGQDELFLKQSIVLDADVETVWQAFTTAEGVTGWMAPVAAVDFRIGGSLRTHYGVDAQIGDPGTVLLHIANYAPNRFITLQADADNAALPPIAKANAHRLFNIIEFNALPDERTEVVTWGIGYGAGEEWQQMIGFFVQGNEWTLGKLAAFINGNRTDWEAIHVPGAEQE